MFNGKPYNMESMAFTFKKVIEKKLSIRKAMVPILGGNWEHVTHT